MREMGCDISALYTVVMINRVLNSLPFLSPLRRHQLLLRSSGWETPLLAFIGVRLEVDTPQLTHMVVPLSWKTRNSWNTMFFAAIAGGVDVCGGWSCVEVARRTGVGVLYKDMGIQFLRRVDSDLHVYCRDVQKVQNCVQMAAASGERENVRIVVLGYCPLHSADQPVVRAELTLSMKRLKL